MSGGGDGKAPIWKLLPELNSKELGKIGPAFGLGAGCGLGFGLGLLGGAGIGPGIPGLQFGFGVGVGCGIGIGFGYGVGKGTAQDANKRYSNVGKLNVPSQEDLGALLDGAIVNTKKLVARTSKEIGKWRR